ncbi:ACP S-malonyltransferase [bacterium]|nr:ACP S-malonyltransferase [bacterium]
MVAIRAELGDQLTQPVRWRESVQAMLAEGFSSFIEVGAGDVLTKLLKRIDRSGSGVAVHDPASLQALAESLTGA